MKCAWCAKALFGQIVSSQLFERKMDYHKPCFDELETSFRRVSSKCKFVGDRRIWNQAKSRLQELLPMNRGLTLWVLTEVRDRLTPKTRSAIDAATLEQFLYVPKSGGLLVLRFRGEATLCHAASWSSLDEFCKALKQVTGISRLIVEGSDLKCRIWFDQPTNQWIRESLEVV